MQLHVSPAIPYLDCRKTDYGINEMKSRINVYQKQYNHWVIRGIYDLLVVVVVVVVAVVA